MTVIRDSRADDAEAIIALYPAAFPGEDLTGLVRALIHGGAPRLSLVAEAEGALAGHAMFTDCGLVEGAAALALLGPLAVAPDQQRRGIGGALVRAGLARLGALGRRRVFVLGDPAYYGRFGFAPETAVTPPYPLPPQWAGAWASVALDESGDKPAGTLAPPAPWMRPELWSA